MENLALNFQTIIYILNIDIGEFESHWGNPPGWTQRVECKEHSSQKRVESE